MVANQVFELTKQSAVVVDGYIVEELKSVLYLTPEEIVSHDSPVNSDAIFDLSVQNPVNGEAHWNGQQVIFIPEPGYQGSASFEYALIDRHGQTDSATVYLAI